MTTQKFQNQIETGLPYIGSKFELDKLLKF